MSRIGRKIIEVPTNVNVSIDNKNIIVKGPKGELTRTFHDKVDFKQEGNLITVTTVDDNPQTKALHGLSRTLLNNMVLGVSQGYEKRLEIIGVGYRAQISGSKMTLSLGYSNPVIMEIPKGVEAEISKEKKSIIVLKSIDKELLGQFASDVRSKRKPEPYKGKGIRYFGEYVPRKAGKTASK